MGKRGPAPKPTKLKELQGNPGKRPLNRAEPKFPKYDKLPAPPSHLNRAGKKEWKRIVGILQQAGLLTEADYAPLAAYCQNYGRWVDAEKIIKEEGHTFTSDKGNIIQHPAVGIASTAMKNMVTMAREFGMTPASRTNIKVDDAEASADPFVVFIGGKKSG